LIENGNIGFDYKKESEKFEHDIQSIQAYFESQQEAPKFKRITEYQNEMKLNLGSYGMKVRELSI